MYNASRNKAIYSLFRYIWIQLRGIDVEIGRMVLMPIVVAVRIYHS